MTAVTLVLLGLTMLPVQGRIAVAAALLVVNVVSAMVYYYRSV